MQSGRAGESIQTQCRGTRSRKEGDSIPLASSGHSALAFKNGRAFDKQHEKSYTLIVCRSYYDMGML